MIFLFLNLFIGGKMQFILIIGAILYFIYEQFEFSKVSRFSLLTLPIITFVLFYRSFYFSNRNFFILLTIFIVATGIGIFQTLNTQVYEKNIQKYFYTNDVGEEKQIYEKIIFSKGGTSYLVGWLLLFIFQIIIGVLIGAVPISFHGTFEKITKEILSDILEPYHIFRANNTWYTWAIYSISNLVYLICSLRKYPILKKVIFEQKTG